MPLHGFTLIAEQNIPELNTHAKLYRHDITGAELLSLENDDENKVFGITFRTPPPDSTGLPHIMEHSVLCGSRKYPVKEPFIELAKGSLNTFINAFTFNDKTSYPVASQNVQDFYNLIDVYLDAVFYPRITPDVLQQEGWHYDLTAEEGELTFKGVVFNEMKGAYSSPEGLVSRYSERSLFPGHLYANDSGGDPAAIPDLTYEQFKTFHETYYHPSNSRFFFYGNDDAETRLRIAQNYLKDFAARDIQSAIPLMPLLSAPGTVSHPYPVSAEAADPKAYITVNWLLPENDDPALTLALNILGHILVGIPASPLRKALIDSGLGEDTIGGGLDDSLRQLTFSTGLKGVQMENTGKVADLIFATLSDLVANGIDPDTIAASLNTIEFQLREQNFGRFPRGVVVMIRALTTWLHDRSPIEAIAFEAPLAAIKVALQVDPRYFAGLIKTHLLDNQHRSIFVLEPDAAVQQQKDEAEKARLVAARESMSAEDVQAVIASTHHLQELQETADTPEALASIPRLTLDDLDKDVKAVPTALSDLGGAQILHHDLFTNGIVYLDVGFDLHHLPQDLLPYASLLSGLLLGIGTENEDFVKLTQRIGRQTGGISATMYNAMKRIPPAGAVAWLFLRGKSTLTQIDDLLAILRDVLLTVKLDNPARFMQMLLERKAREEAALIPAGHRAALYRLRSKFNEAAWATEQMEGVSYLFFLRQLIEQAQQDWPTVLAKLEQVRTLLVNRTAMLCNITLDADAWATVQPKLAAFLDALPASDSTPVAWTPAYHLAPEGLTIPAQVNYVAKGGPLFDLGYTRTGTTEVVTNIIRTTWLWEKIRIQGGAYGAFCVFDPHAGLFSYASYRDPNLLNTLANYDGTSTFLKELDLSDDELVKSIIGAIGTLDAYQLPDAKGYSALARHLIGYTHEDRQQYRDQVLSTTLDDFKALGEVLEKLNDKASVVVIGAAEALDKALEEGDVRFSVTKIL